MASLQRMRMLLPNAHVNLDAEFVGPIANRPNEVFLAHAVVFVFNLVVECFAPVHPRLAVKYLRRHVAAEGVLYQRVAHSIICHGHAAIKLGTKCFGQGFLVDGLASSVRTGPLIATNPKLIIERTRNCYFWTTIVIFWTSEGGAL